MAIQLIVRADDAAGSMAANRAIVEALAAGTVRNVSVMGCGTDDVLADFTSRFYGLSPNTRAGLDLGLHVTLNAEWSTSSVRFHPCLPSAQVPSLVEEDGGFFTPSPAHLHRQGWGAMQVDESLREVRAQLRRLRSAGLAPVYLDEHMGVGWLPGLRDALIAFARKEGLIPVESLRLVGVPLAPVRPEDDADALVRLYLDAVTQANAASSGGTQPFLLVAHPAYDSAETRLFYNGDVAAGTVAKERERERQALSQSDLAARFQEQGAHLLRYSDVGRTA